MKKALFSLAGLVLGCTLVFAQEEQKQEDYYELSLEDLMNIPINSASKKDETLFDAPLSSYTVTKSDIEKSGVTSIMEALRLVPGLIVREQSNGVYDIHIRGFDNILRYSESFTKNNLYTLVMIDGRPAFNHNLGGTFWEALPIDLLDVERIEIVRGPSAPLFGPNAVTGVINVITKRISKEGTTVNAKLEGGLPNSLLANASVGRKFNSKFSTSVSGNYQLRNRFNDLFYQTSTGQYKPGDLFISNFPNSFPSPSQAVKRMGINAFANYSPSEKVNVDLSLGYQENDALKNILSSGGTVLNTTTSRSFYSNLAATISNLSLRTSIVTGYDNIEVGYIPGEYDYTVLDASAEYAIKVGSKATLTPGLSFQNAVYGDEEYFNRYGEGFLSGKEETITTSSAFIRSDINLTDRWRVLAAVRADKFSVPDDLYFAYELATTFKMNDKNLIRFAATRSNSGAFMGYNKLNFRDRSAQQLVGDVYVDRLQRGRDDLNLLTVNLIEVGFRSKLSENLQLDVDVFRQSIENLTTFIVKGFDNYPNVGPTSNVLIDFDNVPTTASQLGTSISLNFIPNAKWQIKPFITLQSTETQKLADNYVQPGLSDDQVGTGFPAVTYSDSKHRYTPSAYGGFYVNFRPSERVNINLNGYYLGAQTWHRSVSEDVETSGQFIVNAKVSYEVVKQLNVYLNGRNVLNNENPQFLGGDQLGGLYMAGLSYNMN